MIINQPISDGCLGELADLLCLALWEAGFLLVLKEAAFKGWSTHVLDISLSGPEVDVSILVCS